MWWYTVAVLINSSFDVACTGSLRCAFLYLRYVSYVCISLLRSRCVPDDLISLRARGDKPPQIPNSMSFTMAYLAHSVCTEHLLHILTAVAATLSFICGGKKSTPLPRHSASCIHSLRESRRNGNPYSEIRVSLLLS